MMNAAQRKKRLGFPAGVAGGLLVIALMASPAAARSSVLQDVKTHGASEHKLEVAFTITGWVQANDIDALAKCLPKKERFLGPRGDATKYFAGIRWEVKRLKELAECNVKHCVFNIPDWARRKVMAATNTADRLRAYYNVIRDISYGLNKKRKYARISPFVLRNEPCGKHDLFHWLLNGKPRSWDRIAWRKHFAKRMRPTLKTIQISSWKAGDYRCIGSSVLFGDHYYYDGLDLLQLSPKGAGQVSFRFHVRERYDVFKEWWARRFRYRIRNMLKDRKRKLLESRFRKCLKGS